VTAAQAAIDAELARDPLARAVHVSEGLYRLRCAPLQVLFELDEHNRQVRVTAVRRFAEV
jgi:hypothetical protein